MAVTFPITVAQFRLDVPAFANATTYPDAQIQVYLDAANATDPARWGQFYQMGIDMFAAHFLALDARDARTIAAGGLPGQTSGIVQSKTLNAASITYNVQLGIDAAAGFWNLTVYGQRYYRFMRIVGAGPTQIPSGYYSTTPANAVTGVLYEF